MMTINYQKFLNEVMRHPILSNSKALEIFLKEVTQKQYEQNAKELKKFLSNSVLINGNMTKK